MEKPPKDPQEPIISKNSWANIVLYGGIIALTVTGAYFFARNYWGLSASLCNNVAFFSLAFTQLLHVLDMRDHDENVFVNQVTRNIFVWLAVVFCSAVLIAVYFIPGLNELLSLQKMNVQTVGLIATSSIVSIVLIQLVKWLAGSKLKM